VLGCASQWLAGERPCRLESQPYRLQCCTAQFPGSTDPKQFEFGQSKSQLHATFGLPDGCNAQPTTHYLRAHEKSPILPDREFRLEENSLP
jgi:hypothetical protein